MRWIRLTLDGKVRWINTEDIAAVEDDGDVTIVYLKNNNSVHIACDQNIDEVMEMVLPEEEEADVA